MADAIATAWQTAERTGDYTGIADLLNGMTAGQLMSQYDLSNEDIAYVNRMAAANVAATQDEANSLLWDTLRSDPAASYNDVLRAGQNLGLDDAGVNSAYQSVVQKGFDQQFGRSANDAEALDAYDYLTKSIGSLDTGLQRLNNRQEGYNYDTNDIVSAFRSSFGRNPTQEEYVSAMAQLGVENFDPASLGSNTQYDAANVAALESDPYAGRYAGFNPYELPSDAANVSTNILGDRVQYISPITQRPVISSFDTGQLELADGLDVLTPQQIEAAIGLATATGGLTPEDRTTMMNDIRNARTVDDLYAAFSAPGAVAALDSSGGQVGVGKSEALARQNGFNGIDLNNLYSALYKDAAPYKFSDTVQGSGGITKTINKGMQATQTGGQKGNALASALMPTQRFANLGTFGMAGAERLGAGNAPYQSDLIKTLRNASDDLVSNNSGFNQWNYIGNNQPGPGVKLPTSTTNGAFNPSVLQPTTAPTTTTPTVTTPTTPVTTPVTDTSTDGGSRGNDSIGADGGGYSPPGDQTTAEQLASAGVTYGNLLGGMLPGGIVAGKLGNAYIDSRLTGAALNGGYTGMYTGDAAFGDRPNNTMTETQTQAAIAGTGGGPLSGPAWGSVDAAIAAALGLSFDGGNDGLGLGGGPNDGGFGPQ